MDVHDILTSVGVSTGLAIWLGKTWLSERLKKSIDFEYKEKLENIKIESQASTRSLANIRYSIYPIPSIDKF